MRSTTAKADAETLRQVRAFASVLWDPGDTIELRAIDPKRGGALRAWVAAGDIDARLGWCLARNRDGCGIYAGANPRPGINLSGDAVIATARVHFADIDGGVGVGEAVDRARSAGLPLPTMAVETGGGVHLYWRLASPEADMAAWRERQRRIAKATGADRSCVNPERVMRVPGFANTKPGREAFPVRVAGLVRSRVADASAFSALPPVDPPRPKRRAAVGVGVGGPIGDDRAEAAWALLDRIDPALLDYGAWLKASGAARLEGVPFERWDAWCSRDAARYTPETNGRKWASLRRDGGDAAGVGSLFYILEQQRPGAAPLVLRSMGRAGQGVGR